MDYAKAKAIRGTSISSLLTDKLVSGEQTIGKSIRSAVSEKMSAKMTGFKEKFDPLNIARALTGGSRLAPALLGRMTGRSKEAISYFANGKKAAPSVTKIPADMSKGSGLGDGALEALSQMFDFMKKSYENNKKRSELQDTFREEKDNEEQQRHNDFLEVLKEYTSLDGVVAEKTAKKEEGGFFKGIMDFISNMISGVLSTVTKMVDTAVGVVKGLINAAILPFKWLLGLEWLKELAKFKTLADIAKVLLRVGPLAAILARILAVAASGVVGYMIGSEIVAPTIDRMLKFHTGDKDITLGGFIYDKTQGDIPSAEEMQNEHFANIIKRVTKNNNSIDEEEKDNLLKQDWVKNDPGKVTALSQLSVIPKVNKSAIEIAGEQLPSPEKRKYNVGKVTFNASTGEMSVPVGPRNRLPDPEPPSGDATKVMDEHQDLITQELTSRFNSIAPIVTNNVNNSSAASKPVSAAASQRDDTDILERVFGASLARF